MAVIVILILIYAFSDYKKTEKAKKEIDKSHEAKRARYIEWEKRVKNEALEEEIWDSLFKLKHESPYYKELMTVYEELGITNRKHFSLTTKDEEITLILMSNRGYLPNSIIFLTCTGYCFSQSSLNIHFRENSTKIIPWVNEKLKQHGVCENVYASRSIYTHDYYLVGSAAYHKIIDDKGFIFEHYIWEPQIDCWTNITKYY